MVLLVIHKVKCMNCDNIFETALPTMWVRLSDKTHYKNIYNIGIEGVNLCKTCRTLCFCGMIINLNKIARQLGYKIKKIQKTK